MLTLAGAARIDVVKRLLAARIGKIGACMMVLTAEWSRVGALGCSRS